MCSMSLNVETLLLFFSFDNVQHELQRWSLRTSYGLVPQREPGLFAASFLRRAEKRNLEGLFLMTIRKSVVLSLFRFFFFHNKEVHFNVCLGFFCDFDPKLRTKKTHTHADTAFFRMTMKITHPCQISISDYFSIRVQKRFPWQRTIPLGFPKISIHSSSTSAGVLGRRSLHSIQ